MNWLDRVELEEFDNLLVDKFVANETEDQSKQRFKITDLSSLNWTLRKLRSIEKNHDEDALLFNAEIERIKEWFSKQSESYQSSVEFLQGLIKEYASEQRAIDPKWKQKTPYGAVSFRKTKKFNYGDEEKLVKYLAENGMGEYVKVVKSPIKSELKKTLTIVDGKAIFTSTGEVLPEIAVEETEDVTIKLEV